MMNLMAKDPWSYVSMVGMAMIVMIQWLTDNVNPIIITVTGFFGIVLLNIHFAVI